MQLEVWPTIAAGLYTIGALSILDSFQDEEYANQVKFYWWYKLLLMVTWPLVSIIGILSPRSEEVMEDEDGDDEPRD